MAGKVKVIPKQTQTSCPVDCRQQPDELMRLIQLAARLDPQRILEIGSLYGGTLWHWMQFFRGSLIVSVDMIAERIPEHRHKDIVKARSLWQSWANGSDCKLKIYTGPSQHPMLIEKAQEDAPYDFIFVDGGHEYYQVNSDYENYFPMLRKGGMIAFHDIAYPARGGPIEVGAWWIDFKARGGYRIEEIVDHENEWGIGVVWK